MSNFARSIYSPRLSHRAITLFSWDRQRHLPCKKSLSSFSFPGPRSLKEILKTDKVQTLTKADITDIWFGYHENKQGVHGSVLDSKKGLRIIERATQCPYFIQPIFRDEGFFVLVSQFQSPSHFLLAYLEDYKMDPNRASPLMTVSIFNDLHESHDLSLIRCDIINKGIEDREGFRVVQFLMESYDREDDYSRVKTFNQTPAQFDVDDFISCMNQKWKNL